MVLRLAGGYAAASRPAGPARCSERSSACLGSGLARRALARRLRPRTPLPAPVVEAAVAYGGTRALGSGGDAPAESRWAVVTRC